MNVRQVLLDAGLNVFGADLLAESFLKSPIAKQALEKGDPVRFFLPVRRSDCAEFVGVEISIAAVLADVPANRRNNRPRQRSGLIDGLAGKR